MSIDLKPVTGAARRPPLGPKRVPNEGEDGVFTQSWFPI